MNILAIGNSFSQDATTFLCQAGAAQGVDLTVVNLYIGGCSLERHWQNIRSGAPAYEYQRNGMPTWRNVSIDQVLNEGMWDVIVTQQASHDSGFAETYEPYLTDILDHLRRKAPNTQILLHQTWAYELDSRHEAFQRYHCDQQEMHDRLAECYRAVAARHGLGLIPSGDVIRHVRTLPGFRYALGEHSLCRDGYHMSLGYGRYLTALCWLRKLCGVSAAANPYCPDADEPVEPALLDVIRRAVDEGIRV